eukprot:jgi/Botrbrau1/10543/Bobra.7_1s0021.1
MKSSWNPPPMPGLLTYQHMGIFRTRNSWKILACVLLLSGVLSSDVNQKSPSVAPESTAQQEQFELSDGGIYTIWYNILNFAAGQLFPATINDTLPTLPWSLLRPNPTFTTQVKVEECSRSEIVTCVYYGNSSNGLPERVHGIFWTDGLGTSGEAFSGAGPYDPVSRVLILEGINRGVAAAPGSSTWNGLFWTPSSIAILNGGLLFNGDYEVHFNEDITFGQIYATGYLLGIKITIPAFLADFIMTWEGQGTWHRISRILGFSAQIGDYNLRAVIDGKGQKTYWFDHGWLTYHGGGPVLVPYVL